MKCPDGGHCHHSCAVPPGDNDEALTRAVFGDIPEGTCWRVRYCGPLSGVYPNDRWPQDVADASREAP